MLVCTHLIQLISLNSTRRREQTHVTDVISYHIPIFTLVYLFIYFAAILSDRETAPIHQPFLGMILTVDVALLLRCRLTVMSSAGAGSLRIHPILITHSYSSTTLITHYS
jgi:hypothetical protein